MHFVRKVHDFMELSLTPLWGKQEKSHNSCWPLHTDGQKLRCLINQYLLTEKNPHYIIWIFLPEEKIIFIKINFFPPDLLLFCGSKSKELLGDLLWGFCIYNLQESSTKWIPITKAAQMSKQKPQNRVRQPPLSDPMWLTVNPTHCVA